MCLKWFLNVFADCLPPESALRVWDVVFAERKPKALYRAALAVMILQKEQWLALSDQGDVLAFAKVAVRQCHDCQALVRCV